LLKQPSELQGVFRGPVTKRVIQQKIRLSGSCVGPITERGPVVAAIPFKELERQKFSVSLSQPAPSACSDVNVSQDVRFHFQIIHPALDDIADADNADELTVSDDGQMAHAMTRHQVHSLLKAVLRGNAEDGRRKSLHHRHGKRPFPMVGYRTDDLTLRRDASDHVSTSYNQGRYSIFLPFDRRRP
jgi:hypothetical protein